MELKEKLHKACEEYVLGKIKSLKHTFDELKSSSESESKSTAGDKHETGRAMLQLEQEKNAEQMKQAEDLLSALQKIHFNTTHSKIASGSLVETNRGAFYISVSAGKIEVEGKVYFAVSAQAPIALKLLGLQEKAIAKFNGVEYQIQKVL